MPKTKFQGFIFGAIMSYSMAIGMEFYNTVIKMGFNTRSGGFSSLTWDVVVPVLSETWYMGLIVIIISSLWGNKLGARFAAKYTNPDKDNPYFVRLMRQAGTVFIMCPSMSLVASILFNIILGNRPVSQLLIIWIGTVMKNFPMAFFWNMFFAAPFTHWVFGKIPFKKEQ